MYKKQLMILAAAVLFLGVFFDSIDETMAGKKTSVKISKKLDPIKEVMEIAKTVDFSKLFTNLHRNHSPEEMRIIGTLALMSGALKAEEVMRENIHEVTDQLLNAFDKSSPKENMQKLFAIEEIIIRDKSSIAVLNGMLKYARNATTLDDFQKDMQQILRENEASSKRLRRKRLAFGRDSDESVGQKNASTGKLISRSGMSLKYNIKERLYDVREMIDNHVENLHSSVTENVKQTIKYVQLMQKANGKLMKLNTKRAAKLDPSLTAVRRLWDQVSSLERMDADFYFNYKDRQLTSEMDRLTKGEIAAVTKSSKSKSKSSRKKSDKAKRRDEEAENSKKMVKRQNEDDENDDDNKIDDDKSDKSDKSDKDDKSSQQNEDDYGNSSDESSSEEEAGGLVGLILNLSGGDEGSDVNAIIGALSQVVANLLGPGGIDVTGIVASSTALLSSFLRGDENFGKFLGNLFGVAIDGFSGGGAVENGQFFGQFLGKFISVLSADADDENAPLQPDAFIINLYDGIGQGSAKATAEATKREDDKPDNQDKNGSDSSSYIASIVSAIIHVAAKASTGSSAGSSQGSVQGVTGLSGGSSSGLSGGSLNST